MKFTLLPAEPLEGTLQSPFHQPEGVFTPVSNVLLFLANRASNVRIHKHSIVVDMEQADFNALLATLTGWSGEAVQRSNSVSAFDGSLAHHLGSKEA